MHQQEHLRFEDEMGVEPAYQALHVLHGPLNSFVDYIAMVSQGVQNFRHLTLSLSILDNVSTTSDNEYSPAASPTSLDHSLPASTLHSTANETQLAEHPRDDNDPAQEE